MADTDDIDAQIQDMYDRAALQPGMSYDEAFQRLRAVGFEEPAATLWAKIHAGEGTDEPPGGFSK